MKYTWVNILKGIGITFVVLGHISSGYTTDLIFLVHMPLFFFISGFLFKKQNKKDFFLKKTISLLLPYFVFLFILYPIEYPYPAGKNILKYILKALYGGQLLNNGLIAFWFITCLFLTQQLFNLIIHKINSKKKIALIVFLFLISSYINSEFYPSFRLPWNANVAAAAIPFFYVGYLFKELNYSINKIILSILFIAALISAYFQNNVIYDMKSTNYGIPFISFILSLGLIFFILEFSKRIQKINFMSYPLKYIGERSIIIMFLHQPIYIYLKNNDLNINTFITLFIITGISCLFYFIFKSFTITRALFLGSRKDLYLLLKIKKFN